MKIIVEHNDLPMYTLKCLLAGLEAIMVDNAFTSYSIHMDETFLVIRFE